MDDNERELMMNMRNWLQRLRKARPRAHVILVDWGNLGSPALAKALSELNPELFTVVIISDEGRSSTLPVSKDSWFFTKVCPAPKGVKSVPDFHITHAMTILQERAKETKIRKVFFHVFSGDLKHFEPALVAFHNMYAEFMLARWYPKKAATSMQKIVGELQKRVQWSTIPSKCTSKPYLRTPTYEAELETMLAAFKEDEQFGHLLFFTSDLGELDSWFDSLINLDLPAQVSTNFAYCLDVFDKEYPEDSKIYDDIRSDKFVLQVLCKKTEWESKRDELQSEEIGGKYRFKPHADEKLYLAQGQSPLVEK